MSFAMQTEPDVLTPDEKQGGILSLLDPQMLSVISVIVGGLTGLAMNVAPRFVCTSQLFSTEEGLKQFNERAKWMAVAVGTGEFSSALMFYCLLFENTSIFKAIQVGYIFWMYQNTRMVAERGYKDPSMMIMSVPIFASVAYGMTLQEKTATTVIFASATMWIAQGLLYVLSPTLASKHWKVEAKNDTDKDKEWTHVATTMHRFFGFWLMSSGASHICLASGGTVPQAIACWHVGTGSWKLTGLLGGEFKKAGIAPGPMMFLIVFHVVTIYVLLAN